jgi:hypothetical protein
MDPTPIPATRACLVDGRPLRVFGGETMFYDTQDEVARATGPLVASDGAIKHAGRALYRIRCTPRLTMAIETERIAQDRGA